MNASMLPREVLKWIQSLDLSFPIKNAKNDIANGYLVAEIFSRYYPKEIDMDSFENGVSQDIKLYNWEKILTVFRKYGFPFEEGLITDIRYRHGNAAVTLILRSYELLTGKKLPIFQDDSMGRTRQPAFARPTASNLIKQKLREPRMLGVLDNKQIQRAVENTIADFKNQAAERKKMATNANSRPALAIEYTPSNPRPLQLTNPRMNTMKATSEDPSILVKEVKVKQITSGSSAMRARATQLSVGSPTRGGTRDFNNTQSGVSSNLNKLSIQDEVQRKIQSYLRKNSFSVEVDPSSNCPLDVIVQYIQQDLNRAGTINESLKTLELISDNDAACIFEELASCFDSFQGTCNLGEVWQVCNSMVTVLEICPEYMEVYDACVQSMCRYGQLLLSQIEDERVSFSFQNLMDTVFTVLMPRFEPLLRESSGKRHSILSVVSSFADQSQRNRIYFIKKLHDILDDKELFIQCLTILVFMEDITSFEGNDRLLDLYTYYAVIGVSSSSPFIRGASLAMFSAIVQYNPDSIQGLFSYMQVMASDTWWEIRAQIIVVACKMLAVLEGFPMDGYRMSLTEEIVELILLIFHVDAPIKIRKLGLSYIGPCIGCSEILSERYVNILVDLTRRSVSKQQDANMDILLGHGNQSEELPVSSACGGTYYLTPLGSSWNGSMLAYALLNHIRNNQLQNLDEWHFDILKAIIIGVNENVSFSNLEEKVAESEEVERVLTYIYDNFKFYVFIALCDPNNVDRALRIITNWLRRFTICTETSFTASVRLLYCSDSASPECQEKVMHLFHMALTDGTIGRMWRDTILDWQHTNHDLTQTRMYTQIESML